MDDNEDQKMEIPTEEFWGGASVSTFLRTSLLTSDPNVLKINYILDMILTIFIC